MLDATAKGVFVICPTPFAEDGALDLQSAERMTDAYLAAGASGLTILGIMPDLDCPFAEVTHDRRQQGTAEIIVEHDGKTAAHRGDERIRRAKVDTDREFMLVGCGRFAGLCNLQKCHEDPGFWYLFALYWLDQFSSADYSSSAAMASSISNNSLSRNISRRTRSAASA